jgi:Short C-terminal domain
MEAAVAPEAETAIADIAQRYGLSRESVLAMLFAVHAGGGTMAQFSIPELGGSGQWMRGGMTMVGGDMFDHALKARVDALCSELAQLLATTAVFPSSSRSSPAGFSSASWWPADLGIPSAAGAQNDARYAIFPSARRLVIQISGVTKVFDTNEHQIGGVQQQQGGGYGTVRFTSQFGTFDVSSLREVGARQDAETPPAAPTPQPDPALRVAPQAGAQAPPVASGLSVDPAAIIGAIESLAGLRERGILSDEEFASKKAELLGRL